MKFFDAATGSTPVTSHRPCLAARMPMKEIRAALEVCRRAGSAHAEQLADARFHHAILVASSGNLRCDWGAGRRRCRQAVASALCSHRRHLQRGGRSCPGERSRRLLAEEAAQQSRGGVEVFCHHASGVSGVLVEYRSDEGSVLGVGMRDVGFEQGYGI